MGTLTINYERMEAAAVGATLLSKLADHYADSLSTRISNKFSSLTGGSSAATEQANYFVKQKVSALQKKSSAYATLAKGIRDLSDHAKSVDKDVKNSISATQEKFLSNHEHLRIDDWKAGILNWLIDLKNSCPLFEMLGNIVSAIGEAIGNLFENIKYWYKCEGGKQVVDFILAIGGAIAAVLIMVATFPASTFVAVCAAIGAVIGAVNAVTNIFTSYQAMRSAQNGDPAWAKIYGDQDKLSDVLQAHNFGSKKLNMIASGFGTALDVTELFCNLVSIGNSIKTMKSKFGPVQNYFGTKEGGLLAYMREAKYKEVLDFDEFGNICGTKMTFLVDDKGVVQTHFTPRSILRGVKSFVMDKPVSCRSEQGLRTMLNQNFKMDFKDWRKSFSIQGFKDTFRYNVTNGGAISYDEWKSTWEWGGVKDWARYNLKNNSFTGMFAKGLSWDQRLDYIKTSGKAIKSFNEGAEKVGQLLRGEFNFKKEVMEHVYNSTDILETLNKVGVTKAIGDMVNLPYTKDGLLQKSTNIYHRTYSYREEQFWQGAKED